MAIVLDTEGNNELMCRIDPYTYEEALNKSSCRENDFSGKATEGVVFVN